MTRRAQHAGPPHPRQPAAARPATSRAGSPRAQRPGHHAAITHPPTDPIDVVAAATAAARARDAHHEHLWAMTRDERTAAFYRGELTFADCQAWSRRCPDEPPTGPCGEYLYILVTTPEWLGET